MRKAVIATAGDDRLETLLARRLAADLFGPADGERLSVSVARRRAGREEIVLLVNESWSASTARLRFARAVHDLVIWDPRTGERRALRSRVDEEDVVEIPMDATESLVLTMEAVGPQIAARLEDRSATHSAEPSIDQDVSLATGCGSEPGSDLFEAIEVGSCR